MRFRCKIWTALLNARTTLKVSTRLTRAKCSPVATDGTALSPSSLEQMRNQLGEPLRAAGSAFELRQQSNRQVQAREPFQAFALGALGERAPCGGGQR